MRYYHAEKLLTHKGVRKRDHELIEQGHTLRETGEKLGFTRQQRHILR